MDTRTMLSRMETSKETSLSLHPSTKGILPLEPRSFHEGQSRADWKAGGLFLEATMQYFTTDD